MLDLPPGYVSPLQRPRPTLMDRTSSVQLTGPTLTVKVPRKFFEDHLDRDCNGGRAVAESKTTVTTELDVDAWTDLATDAAYYSDRSQFEREMHGLCSSAAATVRALNKVRAEVPWT